MKQLAILFPPPMTAQQLAAAMKLNEIVERERQTFAVQDYARRRAAALKGVSSRTCTRGQSTERGN